MRVAVLGDIHANAPALAVVLAAARREGVESLVVTGDHVGYYYWPREIVEMLDEWPRSSVRGNHDRMMVDALADPELAARCRAKYGSGLDVALRDLTSEQRESLVTLPDQQRIESDGCRLLVVHGTPWDPDEYLYPTAPDAQWEALAGEGTDFVVYGHTHYAVVRKVHDCVVVNPGSVGQPRDRRPGAAWALIDTAARSATLHREQYDVAPVAAEARRRDPHLPYLGDVLSRT